MRRIFLAILLFTLGVAQAFAVSTTVTALTTSWQSLGAGPLLLSGNNGIFVISDANPGVGIKLGTPINSTPVQIQTSSNVWVELTDSQFLGSVISAPINGFSSGGFPTNAAIGSTTAGQTGTLAMGAASTASPTYTNAQTNPLSLDTNGNLRVAPYIGSAPLSVGAGVVDTSTQRITVANDSPTAPFAAISTGSVTRYTDASGNYTANTGWNNSNAATYFTFANVCRINAGIVLVPQIDIYSSTNPATKLQGILWLFSAIPGTVIADNATFTIAAADFVNLTGPMSGLSFTLANNQASGAANSSTTFSGSTYVMKCASGATSIYGMVQVVNTYTKAASEVLTIKLRTVGAN